MAAPDYDVVDVDVDVVVVGAGGAGARAAIEADARGASVALLTKGMVARSGATPMACPSYQAAIAHQDPRDTPELAFEDTCMEGRYLGDENLIWAMTTEASDRARDLESYGLKLEKENGHWFQVRHPGQSYPRNLVMRGCGYAQMVALKRQLNRQPSIQLFQDHTVLGLLQGHGGGAVAGVVATDVRSGRYVVFRAPAVVLATGGHLQLWAFTDTAPDNTGDGMVLALRAGARLVDMEMMLYYPSCLRWPPELSGTLVQYEGLTDPWYIGAPMLNGRNERFLPEGERLPVRDELMRLMFAEIDAGRGTPNRGIYIDIPHARRQGEELYHWLHRLDSLPYSYLRDLEVDVREQPIEVAPGAHFALGGIHIDEHATTRIAGLFAAGECAGNTHGANRTSGNALAEGQVFGRRAGIEAADAARGAARPTIDAEQVGELLAQTEALLGEPGPADRPLTIRRRLRAVMEERVGHRRNEETLRCALDEVRELREHAAARMRAHRLPGFNYELSEAIETLFMLDLAEVVIESARERRESRGHHWRTDYPDPSPAWLKHTIVEASGTFVGDRLSVRGDGWYQLGAAPVVRRQPRTGIGDGYPKAAITRKRTVGLEAYTEGAADEALHSIGVESG